VPPVRRVHEGQRPLFLPPGIRRRRLFGAALWVASRWCQCVSSVSWVLRINACIAICSVVLFVYRISRSEVGALAHRAVPATIEYHVT
jgi:hypothetical protein